MRIALTLVLALMFAAGITCAQNLQSALTQASLADELMPDLAANAESRTLPPPMVAALTEAVPGPSYEAPAADYEAGGVTISAIEPAEVDIFVTEIYEPEDTQYRYVYLMPTGDPRYPSAVPEPGSLLVLAVGISGLASWRFRARYGKTS